MNVKRSITILSEEVIGVAGENQYNIIGAQHRTYQCPGCKKNIHCIAGFKEPGDPVELLKDRCGNDCECKCRTYYLAKNGKLRKYGLPDDTDVLEGFATERERNSTDDLIDQINEEYRERHS
jgi:hypothetical protein